MKSVGPFSRPNRQSCFEPGKFLQENLILVGRGTPAPSRSQPSPATNPHCVEPRIYPHTPPSLSLVPTLAAVASQPFLLGLLSSLLSPSFSRRRPLTSPVRPSSTPRCYCRVASRGRQPPPTRHRWASGRWSRAACTHCRPLR